MNKVHLTTKLRRLKRIAENSFTFTPTENVPLYFDEMSEFGFLEGLYVTDKFRDDIDAIDPKVIFGGRNNLIGEVNKIQNTWAKILRAEACSLRLLSGLNAYATVFMSIGEIGDTVLILPENAGGHFSVHAILERLGFNVVEMIPNFDRCSLDIQKTNELIERLRPRFILFDRSEGLIYEDLSELRLDKCEYSIFDVSQYLANVIAGDFKHPFDMGFDALIGTMHKNFPGPQKAMFATKRFDKFWEKLERDLGLFISNTHAFNIFLAGMATTNMEFISNYSAEILTTAGTVRRTLCQKLDGGLDTQSNQQGTHHCWLTYANKHEAFNAYKALEKCRIFTNYRLLPYNLGHGIRMGTSHAVMSGLTEKSAGELSNLIIEVLNSGGTPKLRRQVTELRQSLIPLTELQLDNV